MAQSDPLQILLTHNCWATRQLIDACRSLSDEQFDQTFELGPGSLRATITHILGAMRGWGDMLAGRDQRPRLETGDHSLDELASLLEEISADLEKHAFVHDRAEIVTAEREGKRYAFTRGGVLTHVLTHGMHHRAQCLNMLRQLGVETLPPSAVVEWMFLEDPIEPPSDD
jgi:uncharacterized damage-inducible protein DinB